MSSALLLYCCSTLLVLSVFVELAEIYEDIADESRVNRSFDGSITVSC